MTKASPASEGCGGDGRDIPTKALAIATEDVDDPWF
jgi:hypothetical protein